jgi:hypothetical protein
VHFLPRFSLFLHGDKDKSAPLQQAVNTAATWNDAASRHSDELVGDDHSWTRHDETISTAKDAFYILTAKAKKSSPLFASKQQKQHSRASSSTSSTALFGTSTSFSATADDVYCDCFEGNRSMFMSYVEGTHTSLIVQDFFREGVVAPVVVATVALQRSLAQLSEKHRLSQQAVAAAAAAAASSSGSVTMMSREPSIGVICSSHGRSVSDVDALLAAPNSSNKLAAKTPVRVAPASYNMVSLFTQNYLELDKTLKRNPSRPVIWERPMSVANSISAF